MRPSCGKLRQLTDLTVLPLEPFPLLFEGFAMLLVGTSDHEVGASPVATAKPIVFVVDDDVWVREALETLIQDEGWQPETFASAQEFLDRRSPLTPSCLVL